MAQCRHYTQQSKWQTLCTKRAHYLVASRPVSELQAYRVIPGACWQHAWYTFTHRSTPPGTQIVEVLPSGEYRPIEIAGEEA